MLHELIQFRPADKYGGGQFSLFAKGPIPAGTAVWWLSPAEDPQLRCYTRRQILEHPQRELLSRFSYMVGHDAHGSTLQPEEDPAWFFNHSCDGNCWYDGDDKVVTKRDVAAGEEITYDYALTETEASLHAGMRCLCGAATCRGLLVFDGYRDPLFMHDNAGHTSSYIARKAREVGWHHPAVYPARRDAGSHCNNNNNNNTGSTHGSTTTNSGDNTASLCSANGTSSTSSDTSTSSNPTTLTTTASTPSSDSSGSSDSMGLFTLQSVSKSEVLLYFGGKVVDRRQLLAVQRLAPTLHFVQVAPALWMVPTQEGSETPDYINHSCDPNCGMLDSVTVVAMRDIGAGEELSIDYGTVMDESIESTGLETFDCCCGAACCRRRVTPRDYMRQDVRDRCQDYFPPFMRAKLAATTM
ncbi:hypothetical protein Agub_g3193 [Astrephomene gubernaculifera]|uniref:Uncharacterized protein n=1 Tax=Astrephomene gubernaculifera TaxID=47775 RepID=A0AAD3DI81_9CHLO|nr:hypothetical protein Agub_g3193 [Astrephomene gubernaculifera]